MMEREGIIIYKCTSHPSNIKNWTPYKFVVDPPQVTLTRLVQGLQNYFQCYILSQGFHVGCMSGTPVFDDSL